MTNNLSRTIVIAALLGGSLLAAQEVTEFKQPGDIIRLEIKFDGPDAAKIKSISIQFGTNAAPSVDQGGFSTSFRSEKTFEPSAPNAFYADATIPKDVASGDYFLRINAQVETGLFQYVSGDQFQFPPFHIRNGKTFKPPKVTVLERKP
ncbi:MAG TPA: hypothetical protein VMR62_35365 [Bryobacteraceae bacterium]|jgi:hypothetical protein|nr:hypothetical protein [Bryobacteraceae bacterium]